jgi:glycosyltransferase involved in cell wall biosynthesis
MVPALAGAALATDELISRFDEARGRGRERFFARVVRFLWRRVPRPHGRTPTPNTTEILFWRGRFRWRDSRRVAIVQDMTTQIDPSWHTAGNVREFGEFAGYVQRHAQHIVTVSDCSRRDIVDRLLVDPAAVSVMPMPIHPQYFEPRFSRGWLTMHRITEPYVLHVGAIEPRKNLRRLIKAFEWLAESDVLRNHRLVLIGPPAWDTGFDEFLAASDVANRVIRLGFIAHDHLPTLYHFAAAVVMPSLYEGFGIPVMEAMCSSGLVIASNAGALPEVLGSDGILFDPADSRAIASALMHALTLSPADAEAYRRRCRRRAEAHLHRLATEPLLPGLRPLSEIQTA